MKLIAFVAGIYLVSAASWTKTSLTKGSQLATHDACVEHAEKFITKPVTKDRAIESAIDHCALDKSVDDKNFVCPHFLSILEAAFNRESTTELYSAESFCGVTEYYVENLDNAAKIPNMGQGTAKNFELSKKCEPTALRSFGPGRKTMTASKVPDFWYAMCMNQDCAHFLPSHTRWCTDDHQPTHSASVCEHLRSYTGSRLLVDEVFDQDLSPEQVCSIYDDFVEETHVNVMAYYHVVHGVKEHPVPSPSDKKRALKSAQMKNNAIDNAIRDATGEPVKSGAVTQAPIVVMLSLAGLWSCRA